jgi:hypothetical protein
MVAVKDGSSWRPQSYHVFNVTSVIQTRQGHLQFPIVTEYDNLADIWDALTQDGAIYCAKLILDRNADSPQGVRPVRSVAPMILNKAGYVVIDPPYYDVDAAEVAQALIDFDWGGDREEGAE